MVNIPDYGVTLDTVKGTRAHSAETEKRISQLGERVTLLLEIDVAGSIVRGELPDYALTKSFRSL